MHAMRGPAHEIAVLFFTHSKLALYLIVVLVIVAKTQLSIFVWLDVELWISDLLWVSVSMLVGALDLNDTFTTAITVDYSIWGSTKVRIAGIHMKTCCCVLEVDMLSVSQCKICFSCNIFVGDSPLKSWHIA